MVFPRRALAEASAGLNSGRKLAGLLAKNFPSPVCKQTKRICDRRSALNWIWRGIMQRLMLAMRVDVSLDDKHHE
jgi:hypothetical protein